MDAVGFGEQSLTKRLQGPKPAFLFKESPHLTLTLYARSAKAPQHSGLRVCWLAAREKLRDSKPVLWRVIIARRRKYCTGVQG